jgi:predicted lipoprotein with Yx(FWY)xxD motif
MTVKRYLLVPLAGTTLAAGISVGSSAATTRVARGEPITAHVSASMPMGHGTAAMMRGKAVANAEVTRHKSKHYGIVLYDKEHFVLYAFAADHGSTSSCYGSCAMAWPPMLTKGSPRVVGLNASLLGTTRRRDGTLQVTYGGHPLYYWSGDTSMSIMCQHVKLHGGYWYVVETNGTLNKAMGMGTMGSM